MTRTEGTFDPIDKPIYFRANQGHSRGPHDPAGLTAGGAFNPDERPIYFSAASASTQDHAAGHHTYVLVAVNELNEGGERLLEKWLDNGATVLLDSGIFALTNEHARNHPGMTMNDALALAPDQIDGFAELYERYLRIVRKFGSRLWGYIELDQGGMENKRRTRQRLHDEGLRPIPVYHPFNDGWDYFDELAETHDRMCFGNVVQATPVQRKRLVATAWERHRKYPDLWIHLLGLTPNEWLLGMPVDSGDSSTWLSSVRWSGYKETSALKKFSQMPRNFQYELGSDVDGETGSRKGLIMSAIGCKSMQRNWRTHLAALDEHLNLPMYPERHPDELAMKR